MRYLCLIHLNESELAAMPRAELETYNERHVTVNRELQASGHFIEAEALDATSLSVCVQVRDGKTKVVDGPFAETKEVVGGVYLIEASDLREAIDIAGRLPAAEFGTIEVRPTMRLTKDGEVIW